MRALRPAVRFRRGADRRRSARCATSAAAGLYDFDFARSYGRTRRHGARDHAAEVHEVTAAGRLVRRAAAATWSREQSAMYSGRRGGAGAAAPARLRERGYNQAELIARPLAKRLGLPFRSYLLVRTRPRPEKLRLTVRERWQIGPRRLRHPQGTRVDKLRVLLVDDVLTTGATLDACSRALREAGAAYVAA